MTAVAAVFALFVGATFTLIGTVGRLPGANGNGDGGTGQLGIKPFTVLAGMLNQKGTSEMFDVTGLPTTRPTSRRSRWTATSPTRAGSPAPG